MLGAMSLAPKRSPGTATLADLLAIPEERRRHEIIDGELVEKEAATGEHGTTQTSVSALLNPFFGSGKRGGGNGPGGWWFQSEVELLFEPREIYRPDLIGWRKERTARPPTGTPITLRPDWIGEILSTNRAHATVKKRRAYHRAQVPHYWLLDPGDLTLSVLRWAPEGYVIVLDAERHERVRPEPFDAYEFLVAEFFGEERAE